MSYQQQRGGGGQRGRGGGGGGFRGGRGRGGSAGPVTCYKCQQQGHMANECPQRGGGGPPTCYKCQQQGHMANECPQRGGGPGGPPASSGPQRGYSRGGGPPRGHYDAPRAPQGRRGGGSSSVSLVDKISLVPDPQNKQPYGWKEFPNDENEIVLPIHRDGGTEHIGSRPPSRPVVTNHYPITTQLPPWIYHYTVTATRVKETEAPSSKPKPKPKSTPKKQPASGSGDQGQSTTQRSLPRDLMSPLLRIACSRLSNAFVKATKDKDVGIITDFKNTIYSTRDLEVTNSLELDITAGEAKIDGTGTFHLTISRGEGDVDAGSVQAIFDGNNSERTPEMEENIRHVIKVLSLLMKNTGDERYNPHVKNALMKIPTIKEEQQKGLGEGLTTWTGLSMTPVYGWKPFINIDIDNSAFVKGAQVFDVLSELVGGQQNVTDVTTWYPDTIQKASGFLFGCKVRWDLKKPDNTRVTNAKAVFGVERDSVSKCSFEFENRRITISDYYKAQYNLTLKYKNGPVLRMGARDGAMVPAELCTIKQGKSINRKLTGDQTSAMITIARKDPTELYWEIDREINELAIRKNSLLAKFGVDLQSNMLELQNARVLNPPKILYGESSRNPQKLAAITPSDGKWDITRTQEDIRFYKPININSWGIVALNGGRGYTGQASVEEINAFVRPMKVQAKVRGMNLGDPLPPKLLNLNERNHEKNLDELSQVFQKLQEKLQSEERTFVLVLIPSKTTPLYSTVKQASELYAGVLTQCIVIKNIKPRPRREEPDQSVIENCLLKINAKVGGVNNLVSPLSAPNFKAVDILKYPVMIMGIDVTHPSVVLGSKDKLSPSYAAVTGTRDRTGMVHMMHVQAQQKAEKGAAEIVHNLKGITTKMMKSFRESTKEPPQKIIVFRDGVGEGQFKEVLHVEMRSIREACQSLSPSYQPQITFITVQKRHKTRLFAKDGGNFSNVEPGTVVDTEIVDSEQLDFYLQSHAVIQGTGRPTRYHLLWDDSDFSVDQLEVLTYYLCYAYCRCNRSVKIPAPTYYAHWAAARAKVLADGFNFESVEEINEYINHREAEFDGQQSFAKKYPFHFV